MSKSFMNNLAFTLAETLIVMGIIGVVAALTLPNLNSSTGDKEKVTKLKKIYSDLNDAFGRAQAVYGPFDEWFLKDNNNAAKVSRYISRIEDFSKVTTDCGVVANAPCWKSTHSTYSNTSNARTFQLADGASMYVINNVDDCVKNGHIWVDIDGPTKGSNKPGYDQFLFTVKNNEMVPAFGDDGQNAVSKCLSGIQSQSMDNIYCTKWIIDYDNLDYLKADSSGKCKNNQSIILDGTTNTTCK
ncbi:type II secretion system protein [bacterium]|nr:type II secretion system protein [bacterium]